MFRDAETGLLVPVMVTVSLLQANQTAEGAERSFAKQVIEFILLHLHKRYLTRLSCFSLAS